jgi:hypothetical protein
MQAQRALAIGRKGAKKFPEHYSEQLICVRYRNGGRRRKRGATVESVIE